MAEDLFGNEVSDLPLTPETSRRITNDMRQVIEVLERATSDTGYLLKVGHQRVFRRVDTEKARRVPMWEAGVVLQLMDTGRLKIGGQHVIRCGAVRETVNSLLVMKNARADLARWKSLKQPTSWVADIA